MSEMQLRDQHLKWVDSLKFFAIFAVFLDHTSGILYQNMFLWYSTVASVSVFVFIGGVTAYRSNIRNLSVPWTKNTLRQLKRILIPYAIATACYLLYANHGIDLLVYLKSLLQFNAEIAFYFIVFYIQLILISRLLSRVVAATATYKHSGLLYFAELLASLVMSALFMCYTYILPVYGGGKFLFGGTYFFLFFAGMVYSRLYDVVRPKFYLRSILCLIYLVGIILCVRFISIDQFAFDERLRYLGGLNPPGPSIMVYSFMVVGFVRSLDEIIDHINSKVLNFVRSLVGKLGQKSLYIFLFHKLTISALNNYLLLPPDTNIWLIRVIYTVAVLVCGCAMGWLIEYFMLTVKRLTLKPTTV